MLKTVTAFRIVDAATRQLLSADNLPGLLTEPTAQDPLKTMWSFSGFSKPDYFGSSTVFVAADNSRVLNVQIRERILPAKVIKEAMRTKLEDLEKRQGYKPHRKQAAEVKEEVTMNLLPTSHIKPIDVPVLITGDYLLIGTSSARLVDIVILLLRELVSPKELSLQSVDAHLNVDAWLMEILLDETTASGQFTRGESVTLKSKNKSVARFKDIDLSAKAIEDRVNNEMRPVELEITYGESIHFAVTDQLLIKRIKFSDVLLKQAQDDSEGSGIVGHFESTVVLVAGELRRLIDEMLFEIPKLKTAEEEEDEL